MTYRVLEARSIEELEMMVNDAMALKFRPVGGIAVEIHEWENERKGGTESATWYYQAMELAR